MAAAARFALACVVLAWLWGCSSADESDGLPVEPGGQTGSLVPRCLPERFASVPAGDGAFVGYASGSGCSGDQLPDDLRLADASGNVIELTPVDLGGGGVLFRANQALAPGNYTVSGTGTLLDSELVVTEAEPLPMVLGSLTFIAGTGCSPTFWLELAPEVVPYKALLRLSVTVDGGPDYEWFQFGELAEVSERSQLTLPCPGVCLGDGPHQLVLSAEIAGEAPALEPLTVDFNATCLDDTEPGLCTLPASGARSAPWLLALTLLHLARARARRR